MTEESPGHAARSEWASAELPEELALLPLFNTVVYPDAITPLAVSQPASIRLVEAALAERRPIVLVALRDELQRPALVQPADLYRIGTAALVHKLLTLPDGTLRIALQGLRRIEALELLTEEPYYRARVRALPESLSADAGPLLAEAAVLVARLAPLIPQFPADLLEEIQTEQDPRRCSFLIASCLQLRLAERQDLLELPSAAERLRRLNEHLARTIRLLELGQQLRAGREGG